jgi:hypothetical protein
MEVYYHKLYAIDASWGQLKSEFRKIMMAWITRTYSEYTAVAEELCSSHAYCTNCVEEFDAKQPIIR